MTPQDQQPEAQAPSKEVIVQHAMPIVGSYIAFSIDIPSTLKALDVHADATTKKLAGEIQTQKYVAYVEQSLTINVFSPWRALTLRPLYGSMPIQGMSRTSTPVPSTPSNSTSANNNPFVESDMFLPVHPTVYHPTSRRSLRPNKPLPWPESYHHTFISDVVVRARNEYANSSGATQLPFRDRKRHKATMDMDGERVMKRMLRRRRCVSVGSTCYESSLRTAAGTVVGARASFGIGGHEDTPFLPASIRGSRIGLDFGTKSDTHGMHTFGPNNPDAINEEHEADQNEDGDDTDDEQSVYTEQDHPRQDADNAAELYEAYLAGGDSLLHLTAITVSYDLSQVEALSDPKGFYHELDQLMRIVEQGKARREHGSQLRHSETITLQNPAHQNSNHSQKHRAGSTQTNNKLNFSNSIHPQRRDRSPSVQSNQHHHLLPESVHDCFSPIRDELLHLLQTFHLLLRRMKRHTTSAASTTPPNVSDTTQGTSSSIRSASTSSSSRFFLRTKSKIKSSLSSRSTAVQKPSSKTSGFSSRVKGVVRLGEDNEKNVHRAEEKLADGPHHPPTQAREPITPASASLGPSSNTLLNRGRLNSMQTNTDTDTSSNRNSLINQIVSVVPHRPMPSAATATTTVAALTMSTKQNTEPETTTIGRTSSLRVIGLVKPRDSRDVLVHSVYQPPSTLVGG